MNVAGTPTLRSMLVRRGESLPRPRAATAGVWKGSRMTMHEPRPPLSSLTAAQHRERAGEYRKMAATARAVGTPHALLRLAEQFEVMATNREQEQPPQPG